MSEAPYLPRAIEVGFPIAEINRLAVPERNSFKPIYQMHKWFARRASCVFRAILLASLKPAFRPDGQPTNLMEEFYKDHSHDPDTEGKSVLDPFMGGGTTVVEALRLGCRVTGIDLNPVAWFIVKTEVEPVDIEALQSAYEALAERPVDWNSGKSLKETLLDLYQTEIEPGLEADVIYTFWVKQAICTDPNCRREVPLFDDYIIARKTPSIRFHPDVTCPYCQKVFDWEMETASLIADPAMMVNASRGSAGEGRPTQTWSYAPSSKDKQERVLVSCPHCRKIGQPRLKDQKARRKRIPLTVLLCPECEAVWQWRGELPEKKIFCPACQHEYDPRKGNVPDKGKFICRCGNVDKIIESIRRLPQDQRLPVRPYALEAYWETPSSEAEDDGQISLIDGLISPTPGKSNDKKFPESLLLPKNRKFFKRFSSSDMARLKQAEVLWEMNKTRLPFPKSKVPTGEKTKSGLLAHHYHYWQEMFLPRQLLALSTLLKGIMAEPDATMREMLLCSFSGALELNNQFCRYMAERKSAGGQTVQGIFARHDYQPKLTITENNVFGIAGIAMGSFESKFALLQDGLKYKNECWDFKVTKDNENRSKVVVDQVTDSEISLSCINSALLNDESRPLCVTDPPYVGNVNYSELSDFYYVWLRLALKNKYPHFAPEYTPKVDEIVENRTRGKSREDFFEGLKSAFAKIYSSLADDGLLVFTFHHTDQAGLVWEGLLESLCETGFEIVAVYPIHGESESSLHLMDKENISYDLIHVCRKRTSSTETRSWAGIRQEVRKKAREELKAIETGRYGGVSLNPNDVRLICIGKCLELYSRHYEKVVDHEGQEFKLHKALQDIGTIVDQLVTREKPLPPELEDVEAVSYAWLRVLLEYQNEIKMDELTKAIRALQVNTEDLKKEGLIIKGRTGRGRFYKVKQPNERLNQLKEKLEPVLAPPSNNQLPLFDAMERAIIHSVNLVDIIHLLIGLAGAGESVAPWLERFSYLRPKIKAALRYVRGRRKDWKEPIDRVLNLVEGTPLLNIAEKG